MPTITRHAMRQHTYQLRHEAETALLEIDAVRYIEEPTARDRAYQDTARIVDLQAVIGWYSAE